MKEMWELCKKNFALCGKTVACSLLILLILALFFISYKVLSLKELRVTFFDVGQGDAIFVTTPSGRQILIDGGRDNLVSRHLRQEMSFFDSTLDMIIATHDDSDHITGLISVLDDYNVETIAMTHVRGEGAIADAFLEAAEKEKAHNGKTILLSRGDVIDVGDGVTMHVLHPEKGVSYGESNDASISLLIAYGEHTFLLTGDLSKDYEARLVIEEMEKGVTVYKAGHHGSNTSSGEVLLSRIKPVYAIISAGNNNPYGHPHEEVLKRLRVFSRYILSTIDRGTITFKSNGKILEVVTAK
jgi:competence protein ComEC